MRHFVDELNFNVNESRDSSFEPANAYHFYDAQPLRIAARASHIDIVSFLLQRGATPNILNNASQAGDRSPLAAAASAASLTIVEMLLNHGAKDDDDLNGAFVIAALREHTGILSLLRDRGRMSADALDEAFYRVAFVGLESMVRLLWSWGAKLQDPLDDSGWESGGLAREKHDMKVLIDELEAAGRVEGQGIRDVRVVEEMEGVEVHEVDGKGGAGAESVHELKEIKSGAADTCVKKRGLTISAPVIYFDLDPTG